VDADLCHPFPVTRKAETDLFGTADAVLFQNGTWGAYDEALRRLTTERGKRVPRGPMSDTRAAALCAHVHGRRVLSKLPGRWVWMDGTQTRLYGDWEKHRGMLASNLHFVRRIGRVPGVTGAMPTTPRPTCASRTFGHAIPAKMVPQTVRHHAPRLRVSFPEP
jgi:hypothetical protein